MLRRSYLAIGVFGSGAIFLALAQNGSPITGQWTLGGPVVKERLQLTIRRSTEKSNMNSSTGVELQQLRGVSRAQLESANASLVQFDLVRDAGTFRMQGYLQNGGGGGNYVFIPNPNFANEMRSMNIAGFSSMSEEKVFAMAVHDVSAGYVREMNSLGVKPDSSDQLMSMRIHNVTPEYVRDMKALGYEGLQPDKLVSMRIHGVSVEFARELKSMGYQSVSTDQMVSMRIHGASTEFIKELGQLGYEHPSINELVSMRIHGVTPEYIKKTREKGLGNLPIEKLVSMRIHGVME